MHASDESLRLLVDPPREGVSNMALDEAALEVVSSGRGAPTLRLYRWSEPTISLGYFQPFAEYEALASPAGDLSVVRFAVARVDVVRGDRKPNHRWRPENPPNSSP